MAEARSYFSVIPAIVRDNPQLADKAKLLYAEIAALVGDCGYCYASNEYLAERLLCGERTISRYISQLQEAGVLGIEMVAAKGRAGNRERRIFVGSFVQIGVDKTGSTANFGETGVAKIGETLNKLNNTGMNISPYNPPKPKKERRTRSEPIWKPERFERFYDFYRRKVMPEGRYPSRMDAVKEWDKLQPDDQLIERIGKALRVQMQSEEWQRGIGIPDPCRYLSHRRWEGVDINERPVRYAGGDQPEVYGWQ